MTHTPTPYRIADDPPGKAVCEVERLFGKGITIRAESLPVKSTDEENAEAQATAEFIVRACNCHERLVDACEYLLNCFHWQLGSGWNKNEAVELAQSAINAAREK